MVSHTDISKKHDAVLLFDCTNGNPNGDPDAGNQPRLDPETQLGLVTDACIKRKIRNYINMRGKDEPDAENYKIFIEEGSVLNDTIQRGYIATGNYTEGMKEGTPEQQAAVYKWMQANFYDLRMFGGVLSTGLKAGQVWGPMQFSPARSIDPISPQSLTITRCARTDAKEGKDNKTMGRKEMIPYGLYQSYAFFNPHLRGESVTEKDLQLLWEAVLRCWEFDRSSARGFMALRGLWIFSHESKYGNIPVHQLFSRLSIQSNTDIPRSFEDYMVIFDDGDLDGVTVTCLNDKGVLISG